MHKARTMLRACRPERTKSRDSGRDRSRAGNRRNMRKALSFRHPARGSGHCNETRPDTSVLRQENIIGPHRSARRHRINGKRQFAKFLMHFLGHDPRISARTNEKEIKVSRAIKGGLQDSLVQFNHIYDRPCPDAIGETEQRAPMRHAAKSKSTFTVSFYWRRTRQMWGIGAAADCHLLLPLGGSERITAGPDAEVNQYRRRNKHGCVRTHEHNAEHHGRREAMDCLPTE